MEELSSGDAVVDDWYFGISKLFGRMVLLLFQTTSQEAPRDSISNWQSQDTSACPLPPVALPTSPRTKISFIKQISTTQIVQTQFPSNLKNTLLLEAVLTAAIS